VEFLTIQFIDPGEMASTEQPPATSVPKTEEVKTEEPVVEVHPRKRKLRPREPEPPVVPIVMRCISV
jgi:hypothetical protein